MSEPESKKLEEGVIETLERWIGMWSAKGGERTDDYTASDYDLELHRLSLAALREKDEEIARLKARIADLHRSIPESDK